MDGSAIIAGATFAAKLSDCLPSLYLDGIMPLVYSLKVYNFSMELSAYIRLVRRWLWLIVLAAVVAGSAAFAATRTQTPLYRASTTIQVGTYSTMSNPDSSMIYTSGQLAQTYVALAKTFPVLDGVVTKLQLPMAPNSLAGIFQVSLIPNTSLMSIT